MSFLQELKRRNVAKVAALYVVAGWLVLQAAELLFGDGGEAVGKGLLGMGGLGLRRAGGVAVENGAGTRLGMRRERLL